MIQLRSGRQLSERTPQGLSIGLGIRAIRWWRRISTHQRGMAAAVRVWQDSLREELHRILRPPAKQLTSIPTGSALRITKGAGRALTGKSTPPTILLSLRLCSVTQQRPTSLIPLRAAASPRSRQGHCFPAYCGDLGRRGHLAVTLLWSAEE
nr:hypothetical protein CFP56_56960 [Quercus suber]